MACRTQREHEMPATSSAMAPRQRSRHLCVDGLRDSATSTEDDAAMKGISTIRATRNEIMVACPASPAQLSAWQGRDKLATVMDRIISFDVGLRNLAFVELSVPKVGGIECIGSIAIHRWEVVDLLEGAKANKVPFADASLTLLEYLDETFESADVVLIENQPCTMNPRLKSVQMLMYAYFRTMNLHTFGYPNVRLLPASGKLQGLKQAPAGLIPTKASSMSYTEKKRASVVACEHYLRNVIGDAGRADMFAGARGKRDDLADCLLQAIAFIERA